MGTDRGFALGQGGTAHQAAEFLSKAFLVQHLGHSDPVMCQKENEPGATLEHLRFEAEEQLTNIVLCRLRVRQQHEKQSHQ